MNETATINIPAIRERVKTAGAVFAILKSIPLSSWEEQQPICIELETHSSVWGEITKVKAVILVKGENLLQESVSTYSTLWSTIQSARYPTSYKTLSLALPHLSSVSLTRAILLFCSSFAKGIDQMWHLVIKNLGWRGGAVNEGDGVRNLHAIFLPLPM